MFDSGTSCLEHTSAAWLDQPIILLEDQISHGYFGVVGGPYVHPPSPRGIPSLLEY